MKKIILTIALLLATSTAFSQKSFTTEGDTYRPIESVKKNVPQKDTATTVTQYFYEYQGSKYRIHVGRTGSCYIIRKSKRTGNEYRQYLGEEISRDICAKMGIAYTAKRKDK